MLQPVWLSGHHTLPLRQHKLRVVVLLPDRVLVRALRILDAPEAEPDAARHPHLLRSLLLRLLHVRRLLEGAPRLLHRWLLLPALLRRQETVLRGFRRAALRTRVLLLLLVLLRRHGPSHRRRRRLLPRRLRGLRGHLLELPRVGSHGAGVRRPQAHSRRGPGPPALAATSPAGWRAVSAGRLSPVLLLLLHLVWLLLRPLLKYLSPRLPLRLLLLVGGLSFLWKTTANDGADDRVLGA
mmetsp:Transcript_1488/g.4209  ORF Transcript_1488/g.4209 Transcript_1488/m.4209 type:complete len:239 (-) Transcript_1488:158-874(-)